MIDPIVRVLFLETIDQSEDLSLVLLVALVKGNVDCCFRGEIETKLQQVRD